MLNTHVIIARYKTLENCPKSVGCAFCTTSSTIYTVLLLADAHTHTLYYYSAYCVLYILYVVVSRCSYRHVGLMRPIKCFLHRAVNRVIWGHNYTHTGKKTSSSYDVKLDGKWTLDSDTIHLNFKNVFYYYTNLSILLLYKQYLFYV